MTTETFYVTGVQEQRTRKYGVTRFDVFVRRPDETQSRLVLSTTNDYCGQLCYMAEQAKQALAISWTDGPFGYELMDCAVKQ